MKKWQALNNKRYAEKRKYGYTQVRPATAQDRAQEIVQISRVYTVAERSAAWHRLNFGSGDGVVLKSAADKIAGQSDGSCVCAGGVGVAYIQHSRIASCRHKGAVGLSTLPVASRSSWQQQPGWSSLVSGNSTCIALLQARTASRTEPSNPLVKLVSRVSAAGPEGGHAS